MEDNHKLTKRYLMSLQEGLFLVSNVFPNSMQSAFAEKVAPLNLRNDQWYRIIAAGVDQRLCYIFNTEKEYTKWLAKVKPSSSMKKKLTVH